MDTIDKIFELMGQRNVGQNALANAIGVSSAVVSQWKNKLQKPSAEVVVKVAKYFNVTTDYLFGLCENPDKPKEVGEYFSDEVDLIGTYRQLTPNSKQIVMTVAQMELRHVKAASMGETPIKITRSQKNSGQKIKVFNQAAAAGTGNYVDGGEYDFEMVSVPCIPAGSEFGIRISGDSMTPQINDGDIVFVKRQQGIEVGEIGIFIYDGEAYCKKLVYRDNNYYLRSLNREYKDILLFGDDIYCVGKVIPS